MRGMRWLITDQTFGDSLLRRSSLDSLGLDTHEILAATADKHAGVFSV